MNDKSQGARSANRYWYVTTFRSSTFGFRLARMLPLAGADMTKVLSGVRGSIHGLS